MPPNSKILLKKGKNIYTRRGGTRSKPSEDKKKKEAKADYIDLMKPVVRQTNSITKEVQVQFCRKRAF